MLSNKETILIERKIKMSRSYKKVGHCKCKRSCKKGKQYANRRLRRKGVNYEIPNGKAYKKLNESWDICDYSCIVTWKNYQNWCERPRWWQEPKKANYFEYYKYYLMK